MNIKIDGKYYKGNSGETLLELARRNKIDIPSLCHKKGFEGLGRCRLCLVEVKEGNRTKIVSSCVYPIKDGIEVLTSTERIVNMRKDIILLLLLRTPNNEYIKKLAREYDVEAPKRYVNIDEKEDCILCGLCVKACEKLGTSAISFVNRGTTKKISTPYDDASKDCIGCGACVEVCPTNAISLVDSDGKRTIWNRTFNLVKCSRCGKYYTTEEALSFIDDKLHMENQEHLCESCNKRLVADKFKDAFQNIF
ncbi:2Fe-2S iron-sulfur cluster-binding protein [Clostridium sp. Cult2]|uniref:2Fe-2S iron-sulfur cluster-binding protein n=1 Tax=Clostridium sp. Cult2 TaxID=2079003 RepID=UPI001F3BE9A0|nr:2Fe-2S iron-sulfur cluster-binding protein [Clostridium sp. Cult2]